MKLKEIPPSVIRAIRLKWRKIPPVTDRDKRSVVPIIVSLTSIPSRLNRLHLVVRSLLLQSVRAEKIVLWLNESLRDSIPHSIKKLESEVFEIRYSPLNCSHRKLIHALKDFPGYSIVTADDDCMYHQDWLENLYKSHKMYPGDIIANMVRKIEYEGRGRPAPYKQWKQVTEEEKSEADFIQVGYAGVLYPKESLAEETTDEELFMSMAPNADDLWFKAMAIKKGTKIRTSINPGRKPITIFGSQSFALHKTNVRKDHNRHQWEGLVRHYRFDLV